MKVTCTTAIDSFKPLKLSIDVETRDEFDALIKLTHPANHPANLSLTELLTDRGYLSSNDARIIGKLLSMLSKTLDEDH